MYTLINGHLLLLVLVNDYVNLTLIRHYTFQQDLWLVHGFGDPLRLRKPVLSFPYASAFGQGAFIMPAYQHVLGHAVRFGPVIRRSTDQRCPGSPSARWHLPMGTGIHGVHEISGDALRNPDGRLGQDGMPKYMGILGAFLELGAPKDSDTDKKARARTSLP